MLGYICEEHNNPADFLLDVINECESSHDGGSLPAIEDGNKNLSSIYHRSQLGQSVMERCERLANAVNNTRLTQLKSKFFSRTSYATNFLWQVS